MQQTRNRISSGARHDGYLSTRNFPKNSKGDHLAVTDGRKNPKPLSSQQAAERAAHQRAADRTANRAAHRFAEIGNRAADHLVGDRARDASRDKLTGRHPAARYVGPENRPDDAADLRENSSTSAAAAGSARGGSGHALLQHLIGGFGID